MPATARSRVSCGHTTALACAGWLASLLACGRTGFGDAQPVDCADATAYAPFCNGEHPSETTGWRDLGDGAIEFPGVGFGWDQDPVGLVLDSTGTPIVAAAPAGEVHVLRFADGGWQELGSPASGRIVSLAVDSRDQPWAAFDMGAPSPGGVRLVSYEGGAWIEHEALDFGAELADADYALPFLLLDANDRPIIASGLSRSGDLVCVHRLESAGWTLLPAPGADCFFSDDQRPSLAFDTSGAPLLAYIRMNRAAFARWSGATWEELAGTPLLEPWAGDHEVWPVVQTSGGQPFVAWVRYGGIAGMTLLRRWDGASWVELAGSGTPPGLGPATYVSAVAAGVTPYDEPLVAFSNGAAVQIRYWDGATWREVFAAPTAGDFQSFSGVSQKPALAIRDGRTCVAFTAARPGGPVTLYARCAQPPWD